ncbi:MAG: M56 family metallopeptidase [Sedimentibacter sp.]
MCRKIPGPMVVGIFRPMLLLPCEDYDDVKLKMILSHEIVHIKRHDTSYKFQLVMVCAIHWFNPFVHIMSRKGNNDMEISCDTKALQEAGIEEKKIYSLMIIDIASQDSSGRFPALFTSFVSEKESLEARIKNIFSSVSKKEGHISLILVIIIALLFGTVIQIGNPAVDDEKFYNQLSQAELYQKPIISDDADTDNDVDINKDDINETGSNINEEQPEQDEKLNIDSNSELSTNDSHIPNTAILDTESQQQGLDKEDSESFESAEIVIVDLNQLNNNEDTENSQ